MATGARIAGAGLSGLAAALELVRHGVQTEVFERRSGVGGRFRRGWQILENGTGEEDALDELHRLGLPRVPTIAARKALLLDGRGGRWEVGSERPFAYFVMRGGAPDTLDGVLREEALAAGVVIHHGTAAPDDAGVIASGPRQADGVAREVIFGSDLDDTVAVLFDPCVTPTGYAYLFCLDGWATFGVAQVRQTRGLRAAQKVAWERFRSVLGRFSVRREHEGGQYMSFSIPAHLRTGDGRWHVGEAAGVQDFLFGLGNRLALRSASLASAGMLGRWSERRFRRELLRPMRTSIGLRFAYERLGRTGFTTLCRSAARGDFRRWLLRLQRPSVVKDALARTIMAAWRGRDGCRHGPLCRWCRRSEN